MFVYIDDITRYSPNMKQHIKDLKKVFKSLGKAELKKLAYQLVSLQDFNSTSWGIEYQLKGFNLPRKD